MPYDESPEPLTPEELWQAANKTFGTAIHSMAASISSAFKGQVIHQMLLDEAKDAADKFSASMHSSGTAFDMPAGMPLSLGKTTGKVRPTKPSEKPFYIQHEERMHRRRR